MRSSSSSSAPVVRATATIWWVRLSAKAKAAPRPREAPVIRAIFRVMAAGLFWGASKARAGLFGGFQAEAFFDHIRGGDGVFTREARIAILWAGIVAARGSA